MARFLTLSPKKSGFYYKLALEQIEQKNISSAIRNLLRAINLKPRESYYIELAELYYSVNSFQQSNDIYIKLLTKHHNADYVLALARNMIEGGENSEEGAEFAFKTIVSLGKKPSERRIERLASVSESEKLQKVFRRAESFESKPYLLNLNERKEQRIFSNALSLLQKNNFDDAIKEISKINKRSDNYIKTQEIIAISAIANGDRELAVRTARNIREIERHNLTAFRAFFEYKAPYNDDSEYQEDVLCSDIILEVEKQGDKTLIQTLAMLFFHYNKHEYFYKATFIGYKNDKWNNKALFRMAVACFIVGKNKEGMTFTSRLNFLYPSDCKGKLLRWLSFRELDKTEWKEVFLSFPERFLNDLAEEFYVEFYENSGKVFSSKCRLLLELLFYGNDSGWYYPLVKKVAKNQPVEIESFLKEILISSQMSYDARLDALRLLLENGIDAGLHILMEDRLLFCKVKSLTPEPNRHKNFLEAYNNVFENLLFLGYSPYYRYLQVIIDKMSKVESKYKTTNILSAVVHYYYNKLNETYLDIKSLTQLYQSTTQSIARYLDIYNIDI